MTAQKPLPSVSLQINLYKDRTKLGQADLFDRDILSAGPFACLGLADRAAAASHSNPDRNPLRPFGDTPTGLYIGAVVPQSPDFRTYGAYGRIMLTPHSGQCCVAEAEPNLRMGLMIHGGALNPAYGKWGGLRPTHGCIRMADVSLHAILKYLDGIQLNRMVVKVEEIS